MAHEFTKHEFDRLRFSFSDEDYARFRKLRLPGEYLIEGNLRQIERAEASANELLDSNIPLLPEHLAMLPTAMTVERPKDKPLADIGGYEGTQWAGIVSERLKGIVESLEPDVHEFYSIPNVVDQHGTPVSENYYFINVLTKLNCVDVEHSDVEYGHTDFMHVPVLKYSRFYMPKIAMKKSVIAGHSIWTGDFNCRLGKVYCSDQLKAAIDEAGLHGFDFSRDTYCEEL